MTPSDRADDPFAPGETRRRHIPNGSTPHSSRGERQDRAAALVLEGWADAGTDRKPCWQVSQAVSINATRMKDAALRAGSLADAATIPMDQVRAWAACGLLRSDSDWSELCDWTAAGPDAVDWFMAGLTVDDAVRLGGLPVGHPDRPARAYKAAAFGSFLALLPAVFRADQTGGTRVMTAGLLTAAGLSAFRSLTGRARR